VEFATARNLLISPELLKFLLELNGLSILHVVYIESNPHVVIFYSNPLQIFIILLHFKGVITFP